VTVQVGPDTKVLKTGSPDLVLDEQALSVGQNIVAFGEFADSAGADAAPVLNATQSRVRMLVTRLHGTVTGVTPGQVNLRLRAIDRLGVGMFDFAGTGITPSQDADPENYEVATATLALTGLVEDEAAKIFGFVRPFGEAPADFEGRTVVDHRDLPVTLVIGWGTDGTTAPFTSLEPTGLVLDLTNPSLGERHHLVHGRRIVDLLDLPASPTVAPPASGRMLFGLLERGHVELFADFDAFVAALAARLGAGSAAHSLVASGHYDESTSTLSANRIAVHLSAAE
jgi:hypothetical protein